MMDWLSGLVGEKTAHIISFIGLFAVFLIAVFVVYAAIKKMTAGTYVSKPRDAAPRLTVTDAAAVDSQRRLILVRRDDVEHLILIGGPSDIVVEQNITRNRPAPQEGTPPRRHLQEERTFTSPQQFAEIAPAITAAPLPVATATPANLIAAPVYQPAAEAQPVRSRAETLPAATQQQAAQTSQPLQTHAQQVAQQAAAAARQQPAPQQRQAAPAPRPTEPVAAKLHPVYPLGQVSRGVIAATSGLAAANNAAQQEMIAAAKRENRAPSLDDVRPGSNQNSGETSPLVLQRATPQIARSVQQQDPSFSNAPAPAAKPQPSDFDFDLESAVAEALSADSEMSFEDLLSSEIEQHFISNEKSEQQSGEIKKPQSGTLNISARE